MLWMIATVENEIILMPQRWFLPSYVQQNKANNSDANSDSYVHNVNIINGSIRLILLLVNQVFMKEEILLLNYY